jgi:hypothetical protein
MYRDLPMRLKKRPMADVHCRLFAEDVAYLKAVAAESGVPWQVELRVRVHKACKAEPQDIIVLKERK